MGEGTYKKKRLDIECMRILAAFFVIFNHTEGFYLYAYHDVHSIQYWFYLFISIFCKFSVPLFFMISGALMLNRASEPLKKLWSHRILHMCCVLIVWSFFYYMILVYKGNEIFNIRHFLTQLYDINWNGSYWYLYAYIPLLVSLPLLQNIAQNLSNKNFIYLFVVYAIYNMCLPSIQYLLWNGRHDLNGNAVLHWISYNIFIFPLAGYFFEHRVKEFWNKRKVLFLWGINIGVILLSCYLTYFKAKTSQGDDIMYSQTFHNTFVLVNGIALFVTLQYINSHTNLFLKMEKVICSLGQCAFGIYLLHIFIKDELGLTKWMEDMLQGKISNMLYAFLHCGAIFICGYAITFIIKKIPFLRRLV